MKLTRFIIAIVITILLIIFLDNKWGALPPLGKLLSPQEGFWQNAEPANKKFSDQLNFSQLHHPVKVWLDQRLVPHIFAQDDHDLYFVQGYITAKFRLWQMEIEARAAAGRASEILGASALSFDRTQRRKGMGFGAEVALKKMEADSVTKKIMDAYTQGVNAYIHTLDYKKLPVEFKLLNYWPERWKNINFALISMYMADELTGNVNDLEYSNMRKLFSDIELHKMFPDFADSIDPIIPKGTKFPRPSVRNPLPPPDSLFANNAAGFTFQKPNPDNGSNNWAVSGQKTLSGAPILCNDPHLNLNLPSFWYELQMHTPQMNVTGVSLAGIPAVIIGFNDSIAWGITNAQRDVKDFYSIKFKDESKRQYLYNGAYRNTDFRVEKINIRGSKPFYDTVAYTVFGPVMYDNNFPDTVTHHSYLALHWQALQPSDQFNTFYLLNRAHNYDDYLNAISYYQCPAQNFVFASKRGDIAIWQQGKFPLRWKDQGKFILPGADSIFKWQGYIPQKENPHIENPEREFVSSANQEPTDSTYPYYYFGDFIQYRAQRINEVLRSKNLFTVQDMMKLQTDLYDDKAAEALPLLLQFLSEKEIAKQKDYADILTSWNKYDTPQSEAPAIFYAWLDSVMINIWEDDLSQKNVPLIMPSQNTTIEWLLRDTAMKYIDNIRTKQKETLTMQVTDAFEKAATALKKVAQKETLAWGIYRGTNIMHLAKLPAFSHEHLYTGGSSATVNATTLGHGPSWRMIVQLSKKTEAYGIYPGGQSGNPGSRYYDDMINDWVSGRYYPIFIFKENDVHNPNIKYQIKFSNGD